MKCTCETYGSVTVGDMRLGDLGLIWIDVSISAPEPKTNTISIQTQNGRLDITEALIDYIVYDNRIITLTFIYIDRRMEKWHELDSRIKNHCHGKVMKIILDTDAAYYWRGRCKVKTTKEDAVHSRFVIEIDTEPYKYDIENSLDDWLWDTFSFETGVIRGYKDLVVSDTRQVTVIGSPMPVVPVFIASGPMTVEYDGKTYHLAAGRNKVYDIYIKNGEHVLTFKGQGTVSIEYRGGSL